MMSSGTAQAPSNASASTAALRACCSGVSGQAVGRRQRRECVGVSLHEGFQPFAQCFSTGIQRQDLFFHGRVFLFAGGEIPHHIAQRDACRAHEGRCAAAAARAGALLASRLRKSSQLSCVKSKVKSSLCYESVQFFVIGVHCRFIHPLGLKGHAQFHSPGAAGR